MSETTFDINKIAADLVDRNIEKVAAKFGKILKTEFEKFKIDFDIAFKDYIKKAYDKYNKVKTFINKTEPENLYDIFECNTLSLNNKEIDPNDVNNVLNISNFIIINGTAGIGKTTLLKHFFINELKKNDLIPVFIELKGLNKDGSNLIKCINDSLNIFDCELSEESFQYALKTGCFLFLFDGCDEIANNKYPESLHDIGIFSDKYNKNYFVITSRPSESLCSLQQFTVLQSLPFTKTQATNLVKRIKYDNSTKIRFIEELQKDLYDNNKSFASNPLLLNIMLITYDDYAEIPQKLHIFYEHAFLALYTKHDATKDGFKREILSNLSYDNFKEVFARFCFISYSKNKYEFSYDDLFEFIKNAIKNLEYNVDIEAFIKDLKDALCVIYLDGITYTFSHRSFQEYFTSLFLKDNHSDQKQTQLCFYLIENTNYHQDKVFSMFYDMARDDYERNILIPILKGIEERLDPSHDRYFNYFKELVSYIGFNKLSNMVMLAFSGDSKKAFILHYVIHYKEDTHVENSETNKKLKELFITLEYGSKDTKDDYGINTSALLNNQELFETIKETWVGKKVMQASNLIFELEKRQAKINKDINDLLGI